MTSIPQLDFAATILSAEETYAYDVSKFQHFNFSFIANQTCTINFKWYIKRADTPDILDTHTYSLDTYGIFLNSQIKAKYLSIEVDSLSYPCTVKFSSLFHEAPLGLAILENTGAGAKIYKKSEHQVRSVISSDSTIFISELIDAIDLRVAAAVYPISLSSVGGTTLVYNSTGPNLSIKGISSGSFINIVDNTTFISINNLSPNITTIITAVNNDVQVGGSYPNYTIDIGSSGTTGSVSITNGTGDNLAGNYAVRIGSNAGQTSQSAETTAVGYNAGQTSQGVYSVAVGRNAGQTSQGGSSVAIGRNAGLSTQGIQAVAIGYGAGQTTQANEGIAIGFNAGNAGQSTYGIAIGSRSAQTSQGTNGIAIGRNASQAQGNNAIAIGYNAGQTTQSAEGISIGYLTGQTNQGLYAIAMGSYAGNDTQGANAVSIGRNAGLTTQSAESVAIGYNAGTTSQGLYGIAIGQASGNNTQGANSVAMGRNAGQTTQGTNSVAIGVDCGKTNQGINCVAVGPVAGNDAQGENAIAIGRSAATTSQGTGAIAIGQNCATIGQPIDSVAIGRSCAVPGAQGRLAFGGAMEAIQTTATAGIRTLPSNPTGFIRIEWNGVLYKIPVYAD